MSGQNTIYEMVTERIITQLEAGTVPWRQPWTATAQMPRNAVSGRPYRGVNVFLLLDRGFSSPYWLTFRQVGSLGGHIRKGEKSTVVVFWKIRKIEREVDGEKTIERIPMLRFYRVWNLEQTDGVTVPPKVQAQIDAATGSAAPAPVEEAEKIVAGYAAGPEIRHGAQAAFYRPNTDAIHLPDRSAFASPEGYYATLFHECGHSTGHRDRLDRFASDGPSSFGSHGYGREELVAEMTAAFLCAEAGIAPATVDNSAAYVASWLRTIREDPRTVVVAAGAAQRAADYILGRAVPGSDSDDA